MKYLLTLLIPLFFISCEPTFDCSPKMDVKTLGFVQPSYTTRGFVDSLNVFHAVQYDSAYIHYMGTVYPVISNVNWGMTKLYFKVYNLGMFEIDEYIIQFQITLETGNSIFVDTWGTNLLSSMEDQVIFDTDELRTVDVKVFYWEAY